MILREPKELITPVIRGESALKTPTCPRYSLGTDCHREYTCAPFEPTYAPSDSRSSDSRWTAPMRPQCPRWWHAPANYTLHVGHVQSGPLCQLLTFRHPPCKRAEKPNGDARTLIRISGRGALLMNAGDHSLASRMARPSPGRSSVSFATLRQISPSLPSASLLCRRESASSGHVERPLLHYCRVEFVV
jgi:hypothetical protein